MTAARLDANVGLGARHAPRPPVVGTEIAVAAGHPLAVQAGLRVAAGGGSAVDAALAAAAALTVLLPDACGIGGDLLLLVRRGPGDVVAVNGVGTAPAAVRAPLPDDGAGLTAVPGFVAGLADAAERHGRLGLDAILVPAVALAAGGFPVDALTVEAVVRHRDRLLRGGADGSPWLPGGRPPAVGSRVQVPALARALQAVADGGPASFYDGATAAAIEGAARADGGVLAADDLRAHRSVLLPAVTGAYRGARVHVQPPTSQAVLLAMALARLDREPAARGVEGVHRAVEAIVAAFAHRDDVLRPDAAETLLRTAAQLDLPASASRALGPRGDLHTTAVCAADADGTTVSLLLSVFDEFGAATWVPEAGCFLNDRLAATSTDRGSPDHVAPGRRPVHTLSPALLERDGTALAVSTPGADGQVQTLLQVLTGVLDDGLDLAAALDRPRWRSIAGALAVEADLEPGLRDGLEALGHHLRTRPSGDGMFGACCAAEHDAVRGVVSAWADPRRHVGAGAW